MVLEVFRQFGLYFQIVFLAIVFVSLGLKQQKRLRLHGITMLVAVVLHLISVIPVMIPSYLNLLPLLAEGVMNMVIITFLIHGIIGVLTIVFAVWIVATWRLRQSLKYCVPKKKMMRVTLILWASTFILAVIFYMI